MRSCALFLGVFFSLVCLTIGAAEFPVHDFVENGRFCEKNIREYLREHLVTDGPEAPSLDEIKDVIRDYLLDGNIQIDEINPLKLPHLMREQPNSSGKEEGTKSSSQDANKEPPHSNYEIVKDLTICVVEAVAAGEALATGSVPAAIALELEAIDRAYEAVKKMQENAKWREEQQNDNTENTNAENETQSFDYYDRMNDSEVE